MWLLSLCHFPLKGHHHRLPDTLETASSAGHRHDIKLQYASTHRNTHTHTRRHTHGDCLLFPLPDQSEEKKDTGERDRRYKKKWKCRPFHVEHFCCATIDFSPSCFCVAFFFPPSSPNLKIEGQTQFKWEHLRGGPANSVRGSPHAYTHIHQTVLKLCLFWLHSHS